jgi:hypothetical protein
MTGRRLLVMIGMQVDGTKELVALAEATGSRPGRGRTCCATVPGAACAAPVLAVGDGALGFWSALREVFPTTREQRNWFYKIANVLRSRGPQCADLRLIARIRHKAGRKLRCVCSVVPLPPRTCASPGARRSGSYAKDVEIAVLRRQLCCQRAEIRAGPCWTPVRPLWRTPRSPRSGKGWGAVLKGRRNALGLPGALQSAMRVRSTRRISLTEPDRLIAGNPPGPDRCGLVSPPWP